MLVNVYGELVAPATFSNPAVADSVDICHWIDPTFPVTVNVLLDPVHIVAPGFVVAIAAVPPFAARFTVIITGVVSTVEHEPIDTTALKAVEAVKFPVANVDAVAFETAVHVGVAAVQFDDLCH